MVNDFFDLLKQEIVSTIEGLIGMPPEVSGFKEDSVTGLLPPYASMKVTISGDVDTQMIVLVPPNVATALGDLMLAGEGDSKEHMDNEDLDAIKEIVSNVLGALSTALGAQQSLPKLSFSLEDATFEVVEDMDWSNFSKKIEYDFSIAGKDGKWEFLIDNTFYSKLSGQSNSTSEPAHTSDTGGSSSIPITEDTKNLNLLLDVKLNVRVRIGTKKML
jgi:flagellar motor switch protein FliN/FliY